MPSGAGHFRTVSELDVAVADHAKRLTELERDVEALSDWMGKRRPGRPKIGKRRRRKR